MGIIAADAFNPDYENALEMELFNTLAIESTYLSAPENEMARCAFGYNRFGNAPSRGGMSAESGEMANVVTNSLSR